MDKFDTFIDEQREKELKAALAYGNLLRDMWNDRALLEQRLRFFSILACVLASICILACAYLGTVVHRQAGELAAIHDILRNGVVIEEVTTTTTTEETTQSVEGDSATINNGSWEQNYGQGGAE